MQNKERESRYNELDQRVRLASQHIETLKELHPDKYGQIRQQVGKRKVGAPVEVSIFLYQGEQILGTLTISAQPSEHQKISEDNLLDISLDQVESKIQSLIESRSTKKKTHSSGIHRRSA
jgi:hypothetical protein